MRHVQQISSLCRWGNSGPGDPGSLASESLFQTSYHRTQSPPWASRFHLFYIWGFPPFEERVDVGGQGEPPTFKNHQLYGEIQSLQVINLISCSVFTATLGTWCKWLNSHCSRFLILFYHLSCKITIHEMIWGSWCCPKCNFADVDLRIVKQGHGWDDH